MKDPAKLQCEADTVIDQRRRERNRTSQRAFRARKEQYTKDLEWHYVNLRQRHEALVGVMRTITGCELELGQEALDIKGILAQSEMKKQRMTSYTSM